MKGLMCLGENNISCPGTLALKENLIQKQMRGAVKTRCNILINRGEVKVSNKSILETQISTCVSVCLYYPGIKLGGITHISRSREVDNTPSGKYIMKNNYYYADNAIPQLLHLFRRQFPAIREKSLEVVVAGGMNNEGSVLETLLELKKYKFNVVGFDVNKMFHRHVRFDTALGIIKVDRNKPFLKKKSTRYFNLPRR